MENKNNLAVAFDKMYTEEQQTAKTAGGLRPYVQDVLYVYKCLSM